MSALYVYGISTQFSNITSEMFGIHILAPSNIAIGPAQVHASWTPGIANRLSVQNYVPV